MAVTQADIDNLNAAIASGARSVMIGGQQLTYNTSDSLIRARDDLQKQLNAQSQSASGTTRLKQSYGTYMGRGYDRRG